VEEKEGFNETNLATKAHSAQTCTWIYEAHVDPQWPPSAQIPAREGALETDRVI